MGTKTSPSRRRASRKPPARRPASRSRAGRRGSARPTVRSVLSPWARDAVGIGLVVFSLLAVLSVWFGAAGPAGRAISSLLRGGFGVADVLVPVAGAYWGALLLRDTAREDRVRMFIGFTATVAGSLGVASLLRGNPGVFGGYAALARAAGQLTEGMTPEGTTSKV